MAHITLTHPDADKPIQVPESQRQHFETKGWKQNTTEKPAAKQPKKTPVKRR